MSICKVIHATLASAAVACAPLAAAQSLEQRDAPGVRMRPVPQPQIWSFVPVDSGHDVFIMMRVRVGADGVVREATPIDGFYTPEQAAGAQRYALKLSLDVTGADAATQEATGYIPIVASRSDTAPQMSAALTAAFQEAIGLIGRKDWPGALAKLDAIQAGDARVLRDYLFLEYLRSVAHAGSGNAHEALRHATTATLRGEKIGASVRGYRQPNKDLVAQALEARAGIQKSLGMYAEALDSLLELQELRERQKVAMPDALKQSMESLRKLIASDTDIAASLRIDRNGSATATLVRPAFSALLAPGSSVTEAWVRCDPPDQAAGGHRTTYAVPLNQPSWTRPDSPGECRIQFMGAEGATLRLIQRQH